MTRNKTYKIYTLGCKVNQYDSVSLSRLLSANGLVRVDNDAAIAIINTCSVTKTAVQKGRRMVKKARAENPEAKIIVMGCWPVVYGKEISGVDLVWETGKLDELTERILNFTPQGSTGEFRISNEKFKTTESRLRDSTINNHQSTINRSRYFIKIQDGCEQYCSYCVIPYARGKLCSRPMDEVIDEVEGAVKDGYGEVVLCGIHLGLYGKEAASLPEMQGCRNDLTFLLEHLVKIKGLGRIRLSSIEVTEVTEGLMDLMSKDKKVCRHLHIPLQSGCYKILKRMNRPYDTGYFSVKIKKIRKLMPDIAITTDVIAGFPGETEKDFQDTWKFVEKMKFSRLHIFPYSAHAKAPVSKFDGQLSSNLIKVRAEKLRQLGDKLEAEYQKKFNGRKLWVVIENERQGRFKGKSEFYFDVMLNNDQLIKNHTKYSPGGLAEINYQYRKNNGRDKKL